ncbi:hypothetical protein [Streptococcus cuniculi]|uniref:Uncharacterized protein n=1 Tax=Streptococcus cuniculi TaxID=1432788 RepID=A0A4Y9JB48_9STRE|nr:hypothetical protein [Streptococcus cuniculi]MBF0778915.1 hypothetical protein [Streptococcus cuniculi]TFU97189.1 hypothetical protein E4T82_09320 [Streptococcus cuniculi]
MKEVYFLALMTVNWDQEVWLGFRDERPMWSPSLEGAYCFSSKEEAVKRVEQEFLEVFGHVGSYQIFSVSPDQCVKKEIIP